MNIYGIGTHFLNRLSFAKKFQVILFTLLLPVIYSAWLIYGTESEQIETINYEFKGVETLSKLHRLRILGAQHRGKTAQWQAGAESVEPLLLAIEEDMQKTLSAAKGALEVDIYSVQVQKELAVIKRQWNELLLKKHKKDASLSSFSSHNDWVRSIGHLVSSITIESRLVLDSHLETYLLMQLTAFTIPQMQEQLGQLRGKGAGVATKGQFDPDSFVAVSTLYDGIDFGHKKISGQFNEISKTHPEYFAKLEKPLNEALLAIQTFKTLSKTKLLDPDTPSVDGQSYFEEGSKAIAKVAHLYDQSSELFIMVLSEYKTQNNQKLFWILSVFTLLLLSAIYLFRCLSLSLDNNVGITRTMAADLEAGVLNGHYESQSQDELGLTVGALNNAYSQLRKVVTGVRGNSNALSTSSSNLQVVSKEVNELGEEQKNRVGIIVTAATELAVTAKEVASHCETAAQETQSAQEQAVQGAKKSQSSAAMIRELAVSIRGASEEIAQLAQQAASISTVIDVIKSIAEQTNLLALNAAIEAARAGEQGRGFAVVADEVRSLANRTQESTNEIESTISTLQQVAGQAVAAMETACEQADSGENEAIETGEMLAKIESSVDQVSGLIQQVATAGEQQAGAADEIAQNIQAVDDASTDLVEKAQGVANIASDVGEGSLQLDNAMQKFKV